MKLKKTSMLIFATSLIVFLASAINTWAVEPTVSSTLVGSYDTPGSAGGAYISGNYAYIADGKSGLQILDISNPAEPSLIGSYDTPGLAGDVNISNHYAYIADGKSGLQVIDISNPTSPSLVGSYDTPDIAWEVYISGNYAYIADGESGLQIINITNPALPTLAGSYNTPGVAVEVYLSGNYAYIADGPSGLQVIDIGNPSAPSLVGAYDTPGFANGVYILGDYAYVADWKSGLQIINITNPELPTLAGSYNTTSISKGIYVSGNYAYLAYGDIGLQIIDISNPTIPSFAGSYGGIHAFRLHVSGNHTYVVDGRDAGLYILKMTPISSNTDADNDGFYTEVDDCDDNDDTIHPGATEVCNDGTDQNCDGQDFTNCPSDTERTYTYKTIDYPGATNTSIYGINNLGQVVGHFGEGMYSGLGEHAFTYDKGVYTEIKYPGSNSTMAYGINDSGQIVGDYTIGEGDGSGGHIFLYDGKSYKNIDVPGADVSFARAINNSGQIVGNYIILNKELLACMDEKPGDMDNILRCTGLYGENAKYHGFIYENGEYTTVDFPNSIVGTYLSNNNNSGQVFGTSVTLTSTSPNGAFLYENNIFTTLTSGYFGAGASFLQGMFSKFFTYDKTKIPTTILDNIWIPTATIYDGAEVPDLFLSMLTGCQDINNSGEIVGYYKEPDSITPLTIGKTHGLIATLVPGPAPQLEPNPSLIEEGENLTIKTRISYYKDIKTPVLYFRFAGGAYTKLSMTNDGTGNLWTAIVDANKLSDTDEVEYYISAEGEDGSAISTELKTVIIGSKISGTDVPTLSECGMMLLAVMFLASFYKTKKFFPAS